jgi:UDP:flavonoid glycosyltransferase YjiC (YdhE family)
MKIVLATFGSRGDVQPMLALTLALQAAGHEALLAGPPEKAAWARELDCPYTPLGEDVTDFIDRMPDAHSLKSAVKFISFVRNGIRAQFDLLPKIIKGADLVVGSSLIFALSSVAEAMSIDYRYIAFAPQLIPSGGHPFLAIKTQRLPKWANRLTWTLARLSDKANITCLVNRQRKRMGLKPVADAWYNIMGHKLIVASDRAISEVPPDVTKPSVVQTGYMHLEMPDPKSDRLSRFLESGPPPVYAGFGSMPKLDQIHCVDTIVKAARLAGQRAIISRFWDEPTQYDNAEDIFFIQKYPHLHLFPKMAAIIHHGGAGTTATAAISGQPQIIVPHILDQYYWGRRIHSANLGPKPIRRSRLSVQKLAAAINACVSDDTFKQTAKATAMAIWKTDGLALTVSELLNYGKKKMLQMSRLSTITDKGAI